MLKDSIGNLVHNQWSRELLKEYGDVGFKVQNGSLLVTMFVKNLVKREDITRKMFDALQRRPVATERKGDLGRDDEI